MTYVDGRTVACVSDCHVQAALLPGHVHGLQYVMHEIAAPHWAAGRQPIKSIPQLYLSSSP